MDRLSLMPMQVKDNVMIVYEPFASKIMNSLSGKLTLKQDDYVSLSLDKVERKEIFIEKVRARVKQLQSNMISECLSKKNFSYL